MNYEELQRKVQPCVDKLIKSLQKNQITSTRETENYLFSNGKKELRVSFWCLYGYSRLAYIGLEDPMPVTDDYYVNTYLRYAIEYAFSK
jgi:hypothetical protein